MTKNEKTLLLFGMTLTMMLSAFDADAQFLGLGKENDKENESQKKSGLVIGSLEECPLHDGHHNIPKNHHCTDYIEEQFRKNKADSIIHHTKDNIREYYATYIQAMNDPDFASKMEEEGITLSDKPASIMIKRDSSLAAQFDFDNKKLTYFAADKDGLFTIKRFTFTDVSGLFRQLPHYAEKVEEVFDQARQAAKQAAVVNP